MVVIEVTNGKPVELHGLSIGEVANVLRNANDWAQFETPDGHVWINPAQVVSVREAREHDGEMHVLGE